MNVSRAPPGHAWLSAAAIGGLVQFGGLVFAQRGLSIALPVGFAMILVQLVMAMVARPPTLNLFAVGLPATLLAGLILPRNGRTCHGRFNRERAEGRPRYVANPFTRGHTWLREPIATRGPKAPTQKRRADAARKGDVLQSANWALRLSCLGEQPGLCSLALVHS